MATKVYDSPTANLFALLAEETEQQERKARTAASKGKQNEMTPKERAEAKAAQDAERKAKREAEKARKEAEAALKARVELVDNTGFSQQRHQRIKETRTQERSPAAVEAPKPKSENQKGPGPKKQGQKFEKNDQTRDSPKPVERAGKGEGKGEKQFNKSEKPGRGREFDKHSQGVAPRKPFAKKGGAGRGNWGKDAQSVPSGTTAAEATTSQTPKDNEDAWENVQDAPVLESSQPADAAEAPKTEGENATEKKEEDKEMTLEEYLAIKAAKAKELEAKLGSAAAQPRSLTEEETKALAKFTVIENTKAKTDKPAQAAPSTAQRKANSPVVLEINPVLPPRAGDKRGKGRFDGNRPNQQQNRGEKKGGRVAKAAKIPKGNNFDSAFPTLG